MIRDRVSPFLAQRLFFLLLGNVLLLGGIALLLKEGASFSSVWRRAGPDVAPVALAGLGMTGLVFAGAIDLSIASVIAVASTVFGILVYHQAPPLLAFAGCFAVAATLSLVNGTLVRYLRIPAIIVTLAGLPFYRGLALILADLSIPGFSGNLSVPDERYHLPGKVYAGPLLAAVVAGALFWEHFGRLPRQWLALGSSEEACRLAGLAPARILQSAFGASGVFLGIAAVVFATRIQAIEPARMALGFELQVIGAVVLGGTHIFGGEGSYTGTVLGAFFLYFVSQLLTYAGVSPYYQDAATGLLILTVIGLDCALQRRRKWLEELA